MLDMVDLDVDVVDLIMVDVVGIFPVDVVNIFLLDVVGLFPVVVVDLLCGCGGSTLWIYFWWKW